MSYRTYVGTTKKNTYQILGNNECYIPLLDAGDIVEESSQDTLKEVLDKIQELKEKYK